MATYIIQVQATSNTSANTYDSFIECVSGAATTSFFLTRVRISVATVSSDTVTTAKIVLNTGVGATGTSYTPVPKRATAPSATTVCKVKNGITAFSVGSTLSIFDQVNINGRAIWEWVPRSEDEKYDSNTAQGTAAKGYIAIACSVSAASVVLNVTAEIQE